MSPSGIKSRHQLAEFLSGEQSVSLLIWVLLANFSSSWLYHCDLHCLANRQLRAIPSFQKLPYSLSHDTFPLTSKPATRQAPVMFWISIPFSLLTFLLSILCLLFPFLRIHVITMVPPWYSRIINPPHFNAPFILKLYGKSSFCQIR